MSYDQFHPQYTPQPRGHGYAQVSAHQTAYPVTDQKLDNTAEVVAAWIIAVLTLGYMLPWAIAATRGKSNSAAIALVDLFTGWTLVGWIAALVMACTSHQTVASANVNVVVAQQFGTAPPQWGWPQQQGTNNPHYPQS